MRENLLRFSVQIQVVSQIDLILGVKNVKILLCTPQQECTSLLGSYIIPDQTLNIIITQRPRKGPQDIMPIHNFITNLYYMVL